MLLLLCSLLIKTTLRNLTLFYNRLVLLMIFQNPSLCFYLVIVQLKNFSLTDQMNSDIDSILIKKICAIL